MDVITTAIIDALGALNKDTINDSYNNLKVTLKQKFGSSSDVITAMEGLERKPYSKGRQATLQEEVETAQINEDFEIVQLAQDLLDQLQDQSELNPVPILSANATSANNTLRIMQQIKSSGILLIIPLIIIASGGYIIFRNVQANADKRLVQDCETQEYCSGRIKALERLVQGEKSLKSYNLEHANLESSNLEGANLEGANLEEASLESANLNGASLYRSNLSRANFNSAQVSNVDFNNSNLKSADFNGADFNSSFLNNANLDRAILSRAENLTFSQLKSACNWEKAFYKVDWNQEDSQWIVDEIANKEYIEKIKQDQSSDPEKRVDCLLWDKKSS